MSESTAQPTAKSSPKAKQGKFASSRILLTRLGLVPVLALLFLTRSGWAPAMQHLWSALGMVLALAGMSGRLWCCIYIAGRKDRKLVTEGPYSMCRHPLYFYSFVGAAGVLLAAGSLLPAVLLCLLFAISYPSVMAAEETKLLKIFGDDLLAYRASTPAFFPNRALRKDADFCQVPPRTFLTHLGSAIFFPILAWAFQWLPALASSLALPVWFTIW